METALEHYLPADHPEDTWDEVVKYIPKSAEDYCDQIDLVSRWFGDKKIARILDVGAGDGSFTATVIGLLKNKGLLAENVAISVIEKEDRLWRKCARNISVAERLSLPNGSYTLSETSKTLLEELDGLSRTVSKFDLIILSHATYYFDNAGATLVYALASRLLSKDGALWTITRDRSCKLYREREKLLLQNSLVDVNRSSFSDSLFDRLNCIYELDPDAGNHQMVASHRSSCIVVPPDTHTQALIFQYLLWLNNLTEKDLNTLSHLEGCIFSETHLLTPALAANEFAADSDDDEHEKLRRISVTADCIDCVRRLAPDIVVHRVSMASVKPNSVPTGNIDGRRRPDEPALLPERFELKGVGFGCYPEDNKNDHTLSAFFHSNTSFLFYPTFYHDFRHQCPVTKTIYDLSDIKMLGTPKVTKQSDYRIRRIRGNPPMSGFMEKKRISKSMQEWFNLIKEVYCEDAGQSSSCQALWSLCVGATVSTDVFRHFPDHQLNSTCGLFLTFSTKHDFNKYSSETIAQMRVQLTQWLGHKFYSDAQVQLSDLIKQAEMLRVLQRPLARLSDALSVMQSDTQELRAILFEPEEALFASHAEIARFFIEGEFRDFKNAGIPTLTIRHTPDRYMQDDSKHLQLIFAGVLAAIFGRLDDLCVLPGENVIIARAKDILSDATKGESTKELAETLKWLLLEENTQLGAFSSKNLSEFLNAAIGDNIARTGVVNAITNIKLSLYAPFKPDTSAWHALPLKLLSQHKRLKSARLNVATEVRVKESPVSYASVLAFLRDMAVALSRDSRPLIALELATTAGTTTTLTCTWRESVLGADGDKIDTSFVRKTLQRITRFPREWRVESANYGDVSRPFIMLANKMLGLNERNGWFPRSATSNELIALEKVDVEGAKWMFAISCEEKRLSITWRKQ